MEINKPDLGIFKGIGRLEVHTNVNKKFFPNVRNINRFDLSHHHRNEYRTNYSAFHKPQNIKQNLPEKVEKNPNTSQVFFGSDGKIFSESWNKVIHKKFEYTAPPKPIKNNQEGLGIDQYEKRTGEKMKYSTISQEVFSQFKQKDQKINAAFKYTRTDRFNPITGEKIGAPFGFEDYAPSTDKKYKANNLTVLPSASSKYDIINGRKLTYT